MKLSVRLFILCVVIFCSCSSDNDPAEQLDFLWESITIDGITDAGSYTNISLEPTINLIFSDNVNENSINDNITIKTGTSSVNFNYSVDGKKIQLRPVGELKAFTTYQITIQTGLLSVSGAKIFSGKTFSFETGMDLSDKFPRISDDELLDLVQLHTFNYFWEFGHPVSGMARERTTSGNTVTTGGTGFGIMAIIAGAERGFITRQEAFGRIRTIVSFLKDKCETYHGAFPHWINGETGKTLPFSTYDNGADIVETALLFEGLLTARAYFTQETELFDDITAMWEAIEWTWFQNGTNSLYWHWSPDHGWEMNLQVSGWNESLIVYVLAASSPTYPISKEVYDEGWARHGAMRNGTAYYNITLPLGSAYGGPLFFSHYSFLGIDPQGLQDAYANYWEQNRNHTLINYNYCITNPKSYRAYGADCWGLTASDGNSGYSAHSPTNDKGVIAPTAALSSMPYTPEESMNALHYFYYKLGDKLWSDYGFYDAFNLSEQWFDNQHIAIDQGPIVIMIENYRTGLLWSLLMSDEEIRSGLKKLGFTSPHFN